MWWSRYFLWFRLVIENTCMLLYMLLTYIHRLVQWVWSVLLRPLLRDTVTASLAENPAQRLLPFVNLVSIISPNLQKENQQPKVHAVCHAQKINKTNWVESYNRVLVSESASTELIHECLLLIPYLISYCIVMSCKRCIILATISSSA